MSKANFSKWIAQKQWAIADAALLLVSVEPTGSYPPDLLNPAEQIRYEKIMRAARQDVGDKLPTSWESRYPGLRATPNNYPHVFVLPGDWIAWARGRKFPIPPALLTTSLPQTLGKKQKREADLEALLKLILSKVEERGETFSRVKIPGTKDQFKRLIKAHCPELKQLQGATLDDYIERAGCRFGGGRNPKVTALWKQLGLE